MTTTTDQTPARQLLRTVFGYPAFRGQQEIVIEQLAAGGDAFVLMPTGGGKSLCYQIPALLRDGVGVVVSPLIALMQDQVAALHTMGVRAAFLNSTLTADAARAVEQAVLHDELDLLYVAPEKLLTPRTLSLLGQCRLALFAIDEAHCVSQWGHDFRADYLGLSVLHEQFPSVPRIACTATADAMTREEIIERLGLREARLFVSGFDRPNIRYRIIAKNNPRKQLRDFLRREHPRDAGIVYCLSRKKTEETAAWLVEDGFDALPYHAGMESEARASNQDRFQREDGVIIVATIAFGMGIDKPDVRFVAHLDLPKSIEAYYQETGRAGRDGLPADAWMVYGMADVTLLRRFIDASEADDAHKALERQKLNTLLGLCETASCRRQVMLSYFGDALPAPCGNCDTCLTPVATWDGTQVAKKALYVVYQTGQLFGVQHLTAILRGQETEKVRQFNHHQLSAFGRGTEVPEAEWPSIFRQLVALDLLAVNAEHGGLRLTPASQAVLRGETSVTFRSDPIPPKAKHERKERTSPRPRATVVALSDPADLALFEALRARRRELAVEAGVPPYVIFHDSTLVAIVQERPTTPAALAQVPGIGEAKLAHFGETFLQVVRDAG